jgi:hypothetical protein
MFLFNFAKKTNSWIVRTTLRISSLKSLYNLTFNPRNKPTNTWSNFQQLATNTYNYTTSNKQINTLSTRPLIIQLYAKTCCANFFVLEEEGILENVRSHLQNKAKVFFLMRGILNFVLPLLFLLSYIPSNHCFYDRNMWQLMSKINEGIICVH